MPLPPVDFPTLGFDVCDWIETYLVHGPGDVQGGPIELDDEFALHVCWAYRLYPKDHRFAGRRMVRRDILSRPKGRAKSELAAMIVCAEALGPVRFDGWDANGAPVGKPITYPFIRCLATEEDQTGNTYDAVQVMLTEGEAANAYALDVGLTRTFIKESGGGEINPSTASNAAKEGGKESFAVADETHLYVLRELKAMHATVRRNLRKRKVADPWMLDTTTAYRPGEKSIAEEADTEYGNLDREQALERGILFDHREAPEPKRWGDNRSLRKALRIGYGPAAEWMDLDGIVSEIRDANTDEADARRFWLNQIVVKADQWIDPKEWLNRLSGVAVEKGSRIAIGFDGSETTDATALVGCLLAERHFFKIALWERPPVGAEGWKVPRSEVDAAMRGALLDYDVVRVYCDPAYWQSEIAAWTAAFPGQIFEWDTRRDRAVASAIQQFDVGVSSAAISHNGDPDLARHIANTRVRVKRMRATEDDPRTELRLIRKEHPKSRKKIDLAMAAVLADEARADAIEAGELEKKPNDFAFL